jgi:pyridinium-3,5-bisthiocarboxylic acid mononucleotide nickel chelatase
VDSARIEEMLLVETSTLGVRQRRVRRHGLPRTAVSVTVLGHSISAKVATLPDGSTRAKPEFADVQRVALATGRRLADISKLAVVAAERPIEE